LDDNNDKVWMFDNEIDWVKRIWSFPARPAAARRLVMASEQQMTL
jgi:hypothetical protein